VGFIDEVRSKTILVVGDFIVDYYRILRPKRLSPEAPVVIFEPEKEEFRLGGAGNVAGNVAALGGRVVLCCGVGEDYASWRVSSSFWTEGDLKASLSPPFETLFVPCPSRKTTIKERLVTRRQQIARIDMQSNDVACREWGCDAAARVIPLVSRADIVVFSDYDHGMMIPSFVNPILEKAVSLGKKVVVDSKAMDTVGKYKGASIVLPNNVEVRVFTGMEHADNLGIATYLLASMRLEAVGLTLGPDGIGLYRRWDDGTIMYLHDPATAQRDGEVLDVTGAGDTVTAAVACALATGRSYEDAIRLANVAAGVVVRKLGVATASPEEIRQEMRKNGIVIGDEGR